jgi:DNA gyrase subunit A
LPLSDKERVMAVIPTRDFSEGKYLVFATRKGMVKKTEFKAYDTPIRADGIIAINIRKGDELIEVRQTSGKDDIIMVSKSGNASRFSEKLARPMGRGTAGVKGMNVADKGNEVLALEVARDEDELFVVTENGYGKRSALSQYPVKGRATKGVLTIKLTTKKGGLAGALIVRPHQELIFISQSGMVQRNSVSGISKMGRATQGVRVMNLKANDRVSAVALVVESANGANGAAPTDPALEEQAAAAAGDGVGIAEEAAAAEAAGDGAAKVTALLAEADEAVADAAVADTDEEAGRDGDQAPSKRSRSRAPVAKPKRAAKPKAAPRKAAAKPKAAPKKAASKPKQAAKATARPKQAAVKAKPRPKLKPNPGTVRGSAGKASGAKGKRGAAKKR